MLLIIEALLLISAALGKDHRAAVKGKIFPLDMALDSVDDQYEGCREKMAELVETKYMKRELSNPESDFAHAWKIAVKNHKPPGENLKKKHSIAIYVYTTSGFEVYKKFNEADRKDKREYQYQTYDWYSLHFLLTEAIQILNQTQNKCYDTYRRTKVEFDKDVLNKEVRFGSFTSSSIDRDKGAKIFGTVSCFEIHTCEGAEVSEYAKLPHEKEVLIPPYETFEVTAVRTRSGQKDLWCDTVYTLKSSGKRSDLNCALFKKPAKTLTKYYAEYRIML
ncbi:NAD(P)(+)--arginine ADP-ribosyltransferase 2-like [Carassius auratus]|uniref:NAD(P)(+)--arginine ADP-ribosyltransferase n=1 Tax=Carassius auratus TaxID=7957 RepID=A0A6P6MJ54_CARAU|nr:NAD(P)(+)--arginine ADP-ribosyltransferase 2-like [Carassius auratus]XP_026096046.1 NAD(P)(+)--arginine ADP-ribosyltransferase 2-like [Carassius auratus]XP_026096047.1 NAD(P)(+)--arginine ADP-ribosyltransferase 2-like [Carassius auratus]